VFTLIRRFSPPGAGLPSYLCHRLAMSLVSPILLYGADLFTPSVGTTTRLDTFWRKVQRWTTNCFSATPTGILSVESCLPPVSLLVDHRQRLAALRVVSSPPSVNPATARLHPSFPSLSVYWAPASSRAITKGLSSVYLPLHWETPRPPDEEPPAGGRSGAPADTLHPRALLDAHDQLPPCLPDPHPPAPVPNGQHLFRPGEESKRDTPDRVGRPLSNSGVLPAPSRPVRKALHGPGQVRRREDPPDEGREKLPGCPPDLEVARRRHLLPPLWLGA